MEVLEKFIAQCADLRVLVVGETITDKFIDVIYEGQSMKSFCPVFSLQGNERTQEGGSAAIANHLRKFVKSVELVSNRPEEIVKTRYVDVNNQKKHVELNLFDTQNFGPLSIEVNAYDVVIVADFGHGYCDEISIGDGFHLMCQTNSNNFGFNRLSKWKTHRKRSICTDLREARLQMNDRISRVDDDFIKQIYAYEMNTEHLFVTMGATGAAFCHNDEVNYQTAYPSKIVDTIGAGDAFFAFACLASHLDLPADQMMIPAALAGSLSTTWLCNEKSVEPQSLKEHAAQFV